MKSPLSIPSEAGPKMGREMGALIFPPFSDFPLDDSRYCEHCHAPNSADSHERMKAVSWMFCWRSTLVQGIQAHSIPMQTWWEKKIDMSFWMDHSAWPTVHAGNSSSSSTPQPLTWARCGVTPLPVRAASNPCACACACPELGSFAHQT